MNKREAIRQTEQENTLRALGFTQAEAEQLRRISMTLRRWYELECGTGDGQVSRSIERDEETDKPFLRIQYPTANGYVDRSYPTPDRENGAKRRLAAIIGQRNGRPAIINGQLTPSHGGPVTAYLQTDPRGACLYIIRPGDVPEGADVSAYYNRGICVY